MNVRKKLKLSHVFESYWDMLPLELHEIIMAYKKGQEEIDEEKKETMRELCEEIERYGELKRKWGIGHIKCIVQTPKCFVCLTWHIKLRVCYVDEEGIPQEAFLGYGYSMALHRVNQVKSSLSFFNRDNGQ